MEENKFEKQVQQKMDELKIQPSDTVWVKIEEQIARKENRRWGLIILFLFFGLILAGGYWLWTAKQSKLSENASYVSDSLRNISKTLEKNDQVPQQKRDSESESAHRENNKFAISSGKYNNEDNNNPHRRRIKKFNRLMESKTGQKTSVVLSSELKSTEKFKEKISSDIVPAASSNEVSGNNLNHEVNDSIQMETTADSLSKSVVKNTIVKESDSIKKKPANTAIVKHSKKNKWNFGFQFSAGISGVGNNFLAFNSSSVYSSPGSLNSSGSGAYSSGFNSPVAKSDFGFIAGVFAEKNISKKIKLTPGLSFKSYSNSITLNDSSGIYRAQSNKNKYTNHFTFIEVPVSIEIQLGKGKNVPLYLQTGLSISQLINSNALQFNSSTGYYYKDNSLFNKTQVGFNTALFAALFSKQKISFLIGPYFSCDFSTLAREGLYAKNHVVFIGLGTKINFLK